MPRKRRAASNCRRRLYPSARPAGWEGRANLQPAELAAHLGPHANRQPARTVTGGDKLGERQHVPAGARWAVRRELVLVLEQAG